MSPPFEESGLRVALPDEGSFRFSACGVYRRVSGRQVCEMDVGWWDETRKSISLLEIKDYSKHLPQKDLRSSLLAKGRDSLVMLHAVWRELSEMGRTLGGELPDLCRKPQKLRLYFVLKVATAGPSMELVLPIKDELRNQIKAYADLLGMDLTEVLLLDHEKAIEIGLPITVIQ